MPDDPKRSRRHPEWAVGLRQLYDSVVEEPLPDSFSDLLSKFDEAEDNARPGTSGKTVEKAVDGPAKGSRTK